MKKMQGMNPSNFVNTISNLKKAGPSQVIFDNMYKTNPRFREFADSMKGKTPEQAFSENGLNFNDYKQYRW